MLAVLAVLAFSGWTALLAAAVTAVIAGLAAGTGPRKPPVAAPGRAASGPVTARTLDMTPPGRMVEQ